MTPKPQKKKKSFIGYSSPNWKSNFVFKRWHQFGEKEVGLDYPIVSYKKPQLVKVRITIEEIS